MLSTAFYLQIDGQTKQQNSIIEVYFKAFVNYKQNDWAKLFLIAMFAYNNGKNASTSYMSFKFNYGYYSYVFYKKNIKSHFKSKLANKLATKLR